MVSLFLLPFLIYFIAFRRQWNLLLWGGTIGYGAWLCLQIQNWWIPYIFGASQHWHDIYYRVFAHSTKILPSFGNHLALEALHLTTHLLLIVIVITSAVGLMKLRFKPYYKS